MRHLSYRKRCGFLVLIPATGPVLITVSDAELNLGVFFAANFRAICFVRAIFAKEKNLEV